MDHSTTPYYHYCSANSFYNIINNKSLWLSSLTASNDHFEGKWLSTVVDRVAREHGLSAWDCGALVNMVRSIEERIDCLGFCMSSNGDLLSQWRGYADDGEGFSIGFSRKFVGSAYGPTPLGPNIALQQITYDAEIQAQLVRSFFPPILQLVSEDALRLPSVGSILTGLKAQDQIDAEKAAFESKNGELYAALWRMVPLMYTFKNQAFGEEREVRLALPVLKPLNNLDFSLRRGRLVPYHQWNVGLWSDQIEQVILGPKNKNPIEVVVGFLARCGLSGVRVTTSQASYR